MAKGLNGGIWLELKKQPACDRPIEVMPAPRIVTLPLMQHRGTPPVLCVDAGEYVRLGQPVAKAGEGISCAVHSPVSGIVSEILESGDSAAPAVVVENDGRDHVYDHRRNPKPETLSAEEILFVAKEASVTSVNGLDRPFWAKLSEMRENGVRAIVVNAVETEPYLCTSQKLLTENPEEIVRGLMLTMICTGAQKAVLAASDDIDPQILADVIEAAHLQGLELKLSRIHQKYPSGHEKYLPGLIGDDAEEAGIVYAEECLELFRAAYYGFPQISRVITVAGDAIGNPQNLEIRVGTPVRAVLDHCGLIFDPERVVLGSAMHGDAITDLNTPVTKPVTGVLAFVSKRREKLKSFCINCGKCVNVCPERLMPNYIAARAVLADFDACSALHIRRCIECGACAYICPGRMPLVELIKNMKKVAANGAEGLE